MMLNVMAGRWLPTLNRGPSVRKVSESWVRRCVRFGRRHFYFFWRWTLRFSLVGLIALSGLALNWLWFDNIYGSDWTAIIGGAFLSLVVGLVTLWTVAAWCFDDLL